MAVSARKVQNKRDSNGVLTGKPGTVYDVNIKYNAPEGKKTYSKKGFTTKKDATQHEAEMKTKLQNLNYADSINKQQRKQTVKEYLEEWVETHGKANLRPSSFAWYKSVIKNRIVPYVGHVPLQQLSAAMVDKMFQQIMEKGAAPMTVSGAKQVFNVALEHARKYRYIDHNPVRDTITKFGKQEKTPDPYTPLQVKELMDKVAGTEWEMLIVLGGLYGLRRSEICGLRWQNVDLDNMTFGVVEQLPFNTPAKSVIIKEMAPPKSNGRTLPITDIALPYFERQLVLQEQQRNAAKQQGQDYYENDLVVSKPNGTPIRPDWVSARFGKELEAWGMPHIRFHDLRHSAATNMHQMTGDFYTVGEVLGHTLGGINASLGLNMGYEAVTARYVDVRLERKKEVLDFYHEAVQKSKNEPPPTKTAREISKQAKKKCDDMEL